MTSGSSRTEFGLPVPTWKRVAIAGVPALGGAVCLLLWLLPPASLRAAVVRVASGFGDHVPIEEIAPLQKRLAFAGLFLLCCACLACLRRLRLAERLSPTLASLRGLLGETARAAGLFLRQERAHAAALIALTTWSLVQGLATIRQPIREDEAINAILFMRRSLLHVVTSYQNNNNHIFHTLLARISTQLLGNEPWAQRIPAFVAGVLLVPAGYAAARTHFSRGAGLITAACIASWPYLVDVSTNARGYTILLLVFLLLLCLLPRLARGEDRGAWAAFVLLSVIGFYTTPLMGLLFGVLLIWLAGTALLDLPRADWLSSAKKLFLACVAVVGLTFLVYLPPIVFEGPRVAFLQLWMLPRLPSEKHDGGPITGPGTYWGVLKNFVGRLEGLWEFWTFGEPLVVASIALAAFVSALVAVKRYPRGFRLMASSLLSLAAFALVFSKVPLPWQLPHLLIVFLMGVGGGAAFLLDRLAGARAELARFGTFVVALAIVLGNGALAVGMRSRQFALPWYLGYYDAPEAAEYLSQAMRDEDCIAGVKMELFPLAYYFQATDPHWKTRFFPRKNSMAEKELLELKERSADLFLIETDRPIPLRSKCRDVMVEGGYAPTGEVRRFRASRIVRYSPAPETPQGATEGG